MEANVLTPLQQSVLTALFAAGLGDRGYYLTGGTALAEYYLQHRYSDDLDLFIRSGRDLRSDLGDIRSVLEGLEFTVTLHRLVSQHITFTVKSSMPGTLKVEFANDVAARMAPPLVKKGVVVDSLEDIAVNKVCAILSRTEPKDFCDLYFILKESRFRLDYLLERAKEKEMQFETDEGKLLFAANLLAVKQLEIPLRMIKPFTWADVTNVLVPLATELFLRVRPPTSGKD